MSETINFALTLDQLEVIADALEFTGRSIEEQITDTTESPEDRQKLLADFAEITVILNIVANAMDTLVATEDEHNRYSVLGFLYQKA